ncbi:unnamed protein product [Chilo suppressalis]|uniref:Uncharacterized protein n=1 Tax=Chilo suppressalis TaxID=168631 RepID=A0ABN8ASV6_CHISP|nr:unnamed protein product [Chilo suppressalis]
MKAPTGTRLSFVMLILVLLPYSSTLSLPSGDPAPGRSPGPPELEDDEVPDLKVEATIKAATNIEPDYDTSTTFEDVELTTISDFSVSERTVGDACAFARIPSDSDEVVTIGSGDSDVNLTVSHPVFEAAEIVRGVVYDVQEYSRGSESTGDAVLVGPATRWTDDLVNIAGSRWTASSAHT